MRKTLTLFAVILSLGLTLGLDAEARRLGGGQSSGMQRQGVTAPANNAGAAGTPGQTAPVAGAPTAAGVPGAAAAATPKRSWMGPVAGIAAGLGLAALASHFGFGEAFANMMTIALLVMAALFVVGFVMRKRAASQAGSLAGAGALGAGVAGGTAAGAAVGQIPAGFDLAAFERTARDQFMALQAANDACDVDRLRNYLTPAMFDVVRGEIAERGDATQKTEVYGLQAQVLNVAKEDSRHVVSVRFTGRVREQVGATPDDLDEVWHLVKPLRGFGGWEIAGIQQAG